MLGRKGKQPRIWKPSEKKVSSRQIKITNSNSTESKEEGNPLLYRGWEGNVSHEINGKKFSLGAQARLAVDYKGW